MNPCGNFPHPLLPAATPALLTHPPESGYDIALRNIVFFAAEKEPKVGDFIKRCGVLGRGP